MYFYGLVPQQRGKNRTNKIIRLFVRPTLFFPEISKASGLN